MTCCSRSDRFFEYAETATEDPNFQDYKTKLEDAVHQYDVYNGVLSYTPQVVIFLTALSPAIQLGLGSNSSYSTIFHVVVLSIDALYAALVGVSKVAKEHYKASASDLITRGSKLNFFKGPPPEIPTEPSDKTSLIIDNDQQIDALRHRLLGER